MAIAIGRLIGSHQQITQQFYSETIHGNCRSLLFISEERLLSSWLTPVASQQGGLGAGALAHPIFGISISKRRKLAPRIGQKVCLAPQSIFSPSNTKSIVTPLAYTNQNRQKKVENKCHYYKSCNVENPVYF